MNLPLQPEVANKPRLLYQAIAPESLLPEKMPSPPISSKRPVFIALQHLNLSYETRPKWHRFFFDLTGRLFGRRLG
jgi:hypothetical protein